MNMRQRRWLELVADFDLNLQYHPGKVNVVPDALSRRPSLAILTHHPILLRELRKWGVELLPPNEAKARCTAMQIQPCLIDKIKEAQMVDPELAKIKSKLLSGKEEPPLQLDDSKVLWFGKRLCVPRGELMQELLSEGHNSRFSIHPGSTKMYRDLKLHFWWPGMKRDIASYVSRCLVCQQVKADRQRQAGMLQPLPIPQWKWEHVTMDFVTALPRSPKGNNAVWVIVDRLTKTARFIPFRVGHTTEVLAEKYVREIVRLHGVPVSIVSDRDTRFLSRFWKSLQDCLGTQLKFSTAYHPQTDGQSERTIQTLEDMLRSCMMDLGGSWEDHLYLVEFSYNNSYQASIQMAPYEALYGKKCRTPVFWDDVGERTLTGPELILQSTEIIRKVRAHLKAAQDRQKSWADAGRRPLEFKIGDEVFLKISPIKGVIRFGTRGKLSPRYVGPFKVIGRIGEVAYRLALPPSLEGVHDVFHVSQLRRYIADPSHVISHDELRVREDMTYEVEPVQILDRREKVLKNRTIPLVLVSWGTQSGGATWEREDEIRAKYPLLFSGN